MADVLDERIELNPEAPFPPFPLWLRVPSDWSQLDTNPGTWARSAELLMDNTFRGSRLPAQDRRAALTVIEDLVADCQQAGAALSLLIVGRLVDGEVASAGIHLAFASDGRAASLGRVHDMLPRSGTVTEIATGAGPAVLHRDRMTMMVPGTTVLKALTSIQMFLPIPDSDWTAVLSTASAFPGLTDGLEQLLRTVGASIRLRPSADGPTPPISSEDSALIEFEPAPAPSGPGIERGFGTLVTRRIGDLVNDPVAAAGEENAR